MSLSPSSNPNAAVGGAAGGAGLGTLTVWLLNKYLSADISPEGASAIAGGVATVVLLIGRVGIVGIAKAFWFGSAKK